MFQRQIPNGEGLKLGIPDGNATLMLVVELRQTGGQLPGTRSRRGDNNQVSCGLNIIVDTKPIFTDNTTRIRRITRDNAVA